MKSRRPFSSPLAGSKIKSITATSTRKAGHSSSEVETRGGEEEEGDESHGQEKEGVATVVEISDLIQKREGEKGQMNEPWQAMIIEQILFKEVLKMTLKRVLYSVPMFSSFVSFLITPPHPPLSYPLPPLKPKAVAVTVSVARVSVSVTSFFAAISWRPSKAITVTP